MLWLVYFESANYAGYGEHRLVEAPTEDLARDIIGSIAEEFYYEQDAQQLEDEGWNYHDDCVYSVVKYVEEFTPEHSNWDTRHTFEKVN